MSGHSKWSKIQHKKGRTDKARSNLFTKLLRSVTLAAQEGGMDPDMNFSLRLAVEKAKAGNVPKDNIDRAIKKGGGAAKDGVVFEEVVYEGFGPHGVALIIEALTDNKNRTVSEIKHLLAKSGGSLAGPGSVQWQFDHVGVARISSAALATAPHWEETQLRLMDAGVLDIIHKDDGMECICAKEDLQQVLGALQEQHIFPSESGLEWVPKESVTVDEAVGEMIGDLYDMLEENDDVRDVYMNI